MKAFLDTETTGTKDNHIAQLSYIITDDDLKVVKSKNFFFAVDSMNPFAARLHGLTVKKLGELSQGKNFAHYADEILQDLADCQLVCHNFRSDHDVIAREFERLGKTFSTSGRFCTMDHFRPVCVIADKDGKSKNPSLKELISFFAIDEEETSESTAELFGAEGLRGHDSRYDAAALFLVCKTALKREDYYCEDIAEPAPSPPAQIVSLQDQRRLKAEREQKIQKQKRRTATPSYGPQKAPYARYLFPVLAALVIISLLLRVRF
jgi:DNA polymerase III epsilon subunit-like protein